MSVNRFNENKALKYDDEHEDKHEWTLDLEQVLDKIRMNSTELSEYHKVRYYRYKSYLKYFRIPTIILSAFSSVFSVGLQNFVNQGIVSIVTCLIGLFVGILNSLELFLSITQTMESELTHSRDFYLLSVDIFKTLLLNPEHRLSTGRAYLDEKYSTYCKLVENSILVDKVLNDRMVIANELIKASVQNALNGGGGINNVARARWKSAFKKIQTQKDSQPPAAKKEQEETKESLNPAALVPSTFAGSTTFFESTAAEANL